MTPGVSLRRRLGIRLGLGVTAIWLAAALGAGLIIRHELDEVLDGVLQETAQRLLPLAVMDIMERGEEDPPRQTVVASVAPRDERLTYLVRDAAGAVLMQSHDADPSLFPPRPKTGFRETATHLIYGESAISGTIFIEVAEPVAHRDQAALEAAATMALPLLLVAPLSLLGVWSLVGVSLRPMLALRDEIEARGGADLSPVAAGPLPTELAPMVDAVNRLLDRLRGALEAERSFTANSAHELRTPIAAALAQTQRLIAESPDGPAMDRARRIEGALHDLARLSEKLMQLAKAEGGGLLAEEAQDLRDVLAHVVDEFRDTAGDVALSAPDGATLRSHMDADAFAILMRNLIENARKHGAPGGPVEVIAAPGNVVRVVNGGPATPPAALARLKSRFERGATKADGAGLGLAIAETIAAGAGGSLTLRSPATGRADGFEAEARLPD